MSLVYQNDEPIEFYINGSEETIFVDAYATDQGEMICREKFGDREFTIPNNDVTAHRPISEIVRSGSVTVGNNRAQGGRGKETLATFGFLAGVEFDLEDGSKLLCGTINNQDKAFQLSESFMTGKAPTGNYLKEIKTLGFYLLIAFFISLLGVIIVSNVPGFDLLGWLFVILMIIIILIAISSVSKDWADIYYFMSETFLSNRAEGWAERNYQIFKEQITSAK